MELSQNVRAHILPANHTANGLYKLFDDGIDDVNELCRVVLKV